MCFLFSREDAAATSSLSRILEERRSKRLIMFLSLYSFLHAVDFRASYLSRWYVTYAAGQK